MFAISYLINTPLQLAYKSTAPFSFSLLRLLVPEQLVSYSTFRPHCSTGISVPSCFAPPPPAAITRTFLYHHLENQIPGYFFFGPFIPNLILFVSRWCRTGCLPTPLSGGSLFTTSRDPCDTSGDGVALLCLGVK